MGGRSITLEWIGSWCVSVCIVEQQSVKSVHQFSQRKKKKEKRKRKKWFFIRWGEEWEYKRRTDSFPNLINCRAFSLQTPSRSRYTQTCICTHKSFIPILTFGINIVYIVYRHIISRARWKPSTQHPAECCPFLSVSIRFPHTRTLWVYITIALLAWFLIISRLLFFFPWFIIYIIYKNLALAVYFRLINSDGRAHETGSIVIALTDGQKREVVKYWIGTNKPELMKGRLALSAIHKQTQQTTRSS